MPPRIRCLRNLVSSAWCMNDNSCAALNAKYVSKYCVSCDVRFCSQEAVMYERAQRASLHHLYHMRQCHAETAAFHKCDQALAITRTKGPVALSNAQILHYKYMHAIQTQRGRHMRKDDCSMRHAQ